MTCFICYNLQIDSAELQQDDGYLTTLCHSLLLDISICQDLFNNSSLIKVCPRCRGNLEKVTEISEEIIILQSTLRDVKKMIEADFVHSAQISAEDSKNTSKIVHEINARLGQNAYQTQKSDHHDIKIESIEVDIDDEQIIDIHTNNISNISNSISTSTSQETSAPKGLDTSSCSRITMECLICSKPLSDDFIFIQEGQNYSSVLCKLFDISDSALIEYFHSSSTTICPDCNLKCLKVEMIFTGPKWAELEVIKRDMERSLMASHRLAVQKGTYCHERERLIEEIRKQNDDDFINPLEFLDVKLNSNKDEEDTPSPANTNSPYADPADDHDHDHDSPQDLRIRKDDSKNSKTKATNNTKNASGGVNSIIKGLLKEPSPFLSDAEIMDIRIKSSRANFGAKRAQKQQQLQQQQQQQNTNQKTNQNQNQKGTKPKSKVVRQNQIQMKKLAEIMSKTKKEKKKRKRNRPSTTLITTCSTCNINFGERRELLNHNSVFHTEIVFCNVCSKGFKAESTLKIHLRTHGIGETLFKCTLCPDEKFFSTKSRLKEHNESAHGEPRSMLCQLCSKGFSRKKDLDIHIASKHIGLRVTCSEDGCDKEFSTPMAMKTHVRKEHMKDFEYFCPVESCNKGFVNLSSRDLHYNRFHLKIKPFKCSECDKDFISNCDLKQHKIQNHSGAHNFPCSSCPKVFATEKKLLRHALEVHLEGESDFSCTKCPKKFANSSRLKDHYLNKHADHSERPIKCSICYRGFVANSHLRVHERKVHKK